MTVLPLVILFLLLHASVGGRRTEPGDRGGAGSSHPWLRPPAALRGREEEAREQDEQGGGGQARPETDTSLVYGKLIPASSGMERAWEVPRNPLLDTASLPKDDRLAREVREGFRIFMQTGERAPRVTGSAMSCNNCHPNGGQREKGMPLVGISVAFPEYNRRAGRLFSLEDRIVGCFLRSCNAPGALRPREGGAPVAAHENDQAGALLSAHSPEVLAVSSYLAWLSKGFAPGEELRWRGHNTIPAGSLIPIDKLDPRRGESLFLEKCANCHGEDGQGVAIGDKKAGPLWGPGSWNDGAGAARTYTLAGIIRYMMPYLAPGTLSDEEAQQLAAFITSKERPEFPWKEKDYRNDQVPVDAVYYRQRYDRHPLRRGS